MELLKLPADFAAYTSQMRRELQSLFKVMKGKRLQANKQKIPSKVIIQISRRNKFYIQTKAKSFQ